MFCLVVHAGSSSGEYGWWEPSATTTQQQEEVPAPAPAHTTTPPSSGPLSSPPPLFFSLSSFYSWGSRPGFRPTLPAFCSPPTVWCLCITLERLPRWRGGGGDLFAQGGGEIYRPTCCRSCGHKSEREWGCKYVFSFYMLMQHSTSFN